MKFKFKRIDGVMLALVVLMTGLGLVALLSASYAAGERAYGDPYHYVLKQLPRAGVGLALLLAMSQIKIDVWRRSAYALMAISVTLLMMVLSEQFQVKHNGAPRWLKIFGIEFQPSEVAKVAVAVFMARFLTDHHGRIKEFGFGFLAPLLLIVLVAGLICLEKDLGGPIVVALTVLGVLLVGGARLTHFALLTAIMSVAGYVLIESFKHRLDRWKAWIDPWLDHQNTGYSIVHSFFAFANGGILGAGPGQSQLKQGFLPEAHTDYIFSILGEEAGLAGVVIVGGLFLALLHRALRIAMASRNLAGVYLCLGAALAVVVPAFLNMYVALSIIPAKGLTLPFFSYGGTSLIVNFIALGLMFSAAADAGERDGEALRAGPERRPATGPRQGATPE